jgi:hypothetical protein
MIIYSNTKSAKKQNNKPGWKKEKEEYDAWLAKHKSSVPIKKVAKLKLPSVPVREGRSMLHETPVDKTIKVTSPELLYKDDPEMLARELKARERKFNTAPAYNKGGDVYMTDEMMKDVMSGANRRRS